MLGRSDPVRITGTLKFRDPITYNASTGEGLVSPICTRSGSCGNADYFSNNVYAQITLIDGGTDALFIV